MKTFINEYGKTAIYMMIAAFFVGSIYYALSSNSSVISDDSANTVGNNEVLVSTANPMITVTSRVVKKGNTFDPMDYVSATDSYGNDIKANIEVYGTVDTSVKGMYDIRYTVRDSLGLFSEKKVTFVVD